MRRPPRPPAEPLFSWPLIFWSVLQGLLVFMLVGAIFIVASQRGMPANEVRALTFFSLVLSIGSPCQQIVQHIPYHGNPTTQRHTCVDPLG